MRRVLAKLSLVGLLAAAPLHAAAATNQQPPVPSPAPSGAPTQPSAQPAVPLLAYYYLWFDTRSWNRAKTDYPELGRYSSDDPKIMRQHIDWAKSAGIDGFIVSWKDTPTNDRRLRVLMDVAKQADFKLAVIYQGLDFSRRPLPVDRVAADFARFRDAFAGDPVFFRLGGKPLTIWSGTWEYSHDDIAAVTKGVRDTMLVLSTEKNLEGYRRLADVTDGDAYYWSSVNPDTNPNYGGKLNAMSEAIHADGKYWIAPFAPGFDARMVGGSKTVDRKNGQTLRTEYEAAVRSSPDVLGLISWNEFSENSHIEPSRNHGKRYLNVLGELRGTPVPDPPSAGDSSDGSGGGAGRPAAFPAAGRWSNLWILAGFPVLLVVGVSLASVVRRRQQGTNLPGPRELAPPGPVGTGRTRPVATAGAPGRHRR